ncbi:unnamed protein product [Durusdinium trenchii]|uniref:Uncharacterized protein n=1 Tax=Durusdinium trenchii TaxID=1381693 RepID=A0ABP0P7E7_9DINO
MGGGASSGAKRKAPKERAPEGVVPSKPRHADEYLRQVQADRKAKRSTKGRATCSTCSTGCTSRLTNQSLTSERSQRSVRSKGTSGTPKSVRFAGQMEDVLDAGSSRMAALERAHSQRRRLTIPESVIHIGQHAFACCSAFGELDPRLSWCLALGLCLGERLGQTSGGSRLLRGWDEG